MRTTFLLALVALLLAVAAPARAGTYHVYSCRTPAGAAAPTDGWLAIPGHAAGAVNGCGAGNLSARTEPGFEPVGYYEGWLYQTPADVRFSKLTVWRNATRDPLLFGPGAFQDNADHTWATWIGAGSPDYGHAVEHCGDGCQHLGVQSTAVVDANRADFDISGGTDQAYFVDGCVGTTSGCGSGMESGVSHGYASTDIQAVDAMVSDEQSPTFDEVAGALAANGAHRGAESLDFVGTDRGAGLYHALVALKAPSKPWQTMVTKLVDPNNGHCTEYDARSDTDLEFGYLVPCVLTAPVSVSFDTTVVDDGGYELRVSLEDAAGNVTPVLDEPFTIDNVPPPAPTVLPSISGQPKLGSTVTAARGTWSGEGNTYVEQWLRCTTKEQASCTPIPGETGDTHKLVTEDLGRFLRVTVTATNKEGSTPATSDLAGPGVDGSGTVPQCADSVDNDKDGTVDLDDPDCTGREDTSEATNATTVPGGGVATPTPTAAPAPTATPAGDAPAVHPQLSLSGPAKLALGYHRSASTTVTLRDDTGRPLAGEPVRVLQRMSVPGAAFVAAHAPVTTDQDGRVRYLIGPGYSRTLRFEYAGVTRDLVLVVASRTTLRTNKTFLRNHQTLRFRGQVVSRPVPTAGVVVDLQAKVGNHWQTFNSLRSDGNGRWHASYTFHATSGLQKYVFRARVRGDTGFPYAPSTSKRIAVHVRG